MRTLMSGRSDRVGLEDLRLDLERALLPVDLGIELHHRGAVSPIGVGVGNHLGGLPDLDLREIRFVDVDLGAQLVHVRQADQLARAGEAARHRDLPHLLELLEHHAVRGRAQHGVFEVELELGDRARPAAPPPPGRRCSWFCFRSRSASDATLRLRSSSERTSSLRREIQVGAGQVQARRGPPGAPPRSCGRRAARAPGPPPPSRLRRPGTPRCVPESAPRARCSGRRSPRSPSP